MNNLKNFYSAFGSKSFILGAVLLCVVAGSGNLAHVYGQTPSFYLKFKEVQVRPGDRPPNEYFSVTGEKYDENGGSVDVTVRGDANGQCPGGAETMRFIWRFGRNVTRVAVATGVSTSIEAGLVSNSRPCTNGLAANSDISLTGAGAIGGPNPFTAASVRGDGNLFYQLDEDRNRFFPYTSDGKRTSGVMGIRIREQADSTVQFAAFEIAIRTPGGQLRYVYLFEIVRGGVEVSYGRIAGAWESDYSGGWRPASIRQEGGRLWFTNEFGDTSEGVFESSSRVKATKWNVGATIQGSTIK